VDLIFVFGFLGLQSFDFFLRLVVMNLNVMRLICCCFDVQGTTVRVEFGDGTTTADPADEPTISRSFPNTYGHPLAHFLRATAKVPDAQIITEHPPIRFVYLFCFDLFMFCRHCCESV